MDGASCYYNDYYFFNLVYGPGTPSLMHVVYIPYVSLWYDPYKQNHSELHQITRFSNSIYTQFVP